MLIIEGPDNAGKTTLAQRLAEDCKLLLIANKRKPRTRDDYFDFLNRVIPLSRTIPAVFDRWTPISEMVYGPLFRNQSIFTSRDLDVAMAAPHLAGCRPLLIYCRPPDEVITDTIRNRDQMAGVPEHITKVIRTYDSVIEHWSRCTDHSYPTARYNYRDPQAYGLLASRVMIHLKEYQ